MFTLVLPDFKGEILSFKFKQIKIKIEDSFGNCIYQQNNLNQVRIIKDTITNQMTTA